MKVRLFDKYGNDYIGGVEITVSDPDELPSILKITPNPVLPMRYFKHFGSDQYYEITETVLSLGNTRITKE